MQNLIGLKKYVIIAAGGSGQRMGAGMPKQFLEIAGKPLLWHSVNAFAEAFDEIEIIVVAPADHLEEAKRVCSGFDNLRFVVGGATRFQSVRNGLAMVKERSIVFVHDGVRCMVTRDLLHRCYGQAVEKGSAIPTIAVNDSIRLLEGDGHRVLDRNAVRIIQTPQVFQSDIILEAFKAKESERFTDEATVVEYSGRPVHLVEGEATNIKITRPVDLVFAEQVLQSRSSL